MKKRFPNEVEKILRSGGWTGLQKDWNGKAASPFPAAEKALGEFGGFYYAPDPATGIEFARSRFIIDPGKVGYPTEYLEEEEKAIGKKLYAIGTLYDEPIDLLIAEDGTPYSNTDYGIYQDGDTFDDALIACILGIRPSPNYTLYPVFNRQAQPGQPPVARCEWLVDKPLLPDGRED
ncbi:SUKH-3 domain-containing protein [Luteolibacter sp. LG18]|uniref:SUKH-3 domain-containing protein n=1 Tax=Luteolibacter sp. LG18 TaxID=2819286 RepID=UPI002B30694C|nr:hypothetical protein llg_26630 [Luteolibacter sp. LG18]